MRKHFHLFLAFILLFSLKGISQTISDTGTLRTTINTQIVPNGQREISANQLNRILNGLMNTLTPYGVDSLSYDSTSNQITGYRYSGFPSIVLQLKRVYNSGSVTSIGLTVPTGFSVSPSTITSSGTFAITDTLSNGVVHSSSGAFVSGKIVNVDVNDVAWTKITGAPSFITLANLSATSPIFYNNSTGVISSQPGSTTQNGYITSSDFLTFSAKQNPITWQNVSAASTKITLGGAPAASVNSPFSIDVNEANLTLSNMGGVVPISKGGTNATGAPAALNNLFPSQSGKSGYSAVSDGTNINWVLVSAGAGFTRVFGTNGISKVNDSTLKQGGQFTQNTSFSGQNLFSLLYDSITTFTLNGKFQTNQKAYYLTHPTFLTADSLAFVDYETLNNVITGLPVAFSQLTDVSLTTLSNGQVPTYNFSTSKWNNTTLNTSIVPEGSNLYFTQARARTAISANSPINYDNTTGIISADTSTGATHLTTQGFVTRSFPTMNTGAQGNMAFWRSATSLSNVPILKYDTGNNRITFTSAVSFTGTNSVDFNIGVATGNSIGLSFNTSSGITSDYVPIAATVATTGTLYTILNNQTTGGSVGNFFQTQSRSGDAFITYRDTTQPQYGGFTEGMTSKYNSKESWSLAFGKTQRTFTSNTQLFGIDTVGNIIAPHYGGGGTLMLTVDNNGNIGSQAIPGGGGGLTQIFAKAPLSILGTDTVRADTSTSLTGLTTLYQNGLKLNKSDTAAMLAPYIKNAFYQTVQTATSSVIQRSNLNFTNKFTVTDNPGNASTDIGLANNAVTTTILNNNAVTYAKIQAASGQSLLGAPGAANFQEITLGTNLSMSGGVLNAVGGVTFDSAVSQGGGFHTQHYNDLRYLKNSTDVIASFGSLTQGLFFSSPFNVTGLASMRAITVPDLPGAIPISKTQLAVNSPLTLSTNTLGIDTSEGTNSAATYSQLLSLLSKDTSITVSPSVGATYTNSALIGKQLLNFFIGGVRIPLTVVTGFEYATFNASTGAISLTNGSFASGDDVVINYVGAATVLGGGGGGGGSAHAYQFYTSGSTVTVSNGNDILDVNPASSVSSLTITAPATPNTNNELTIFFGGTISSGGVVITSLSIIGNSGQSILQITSPTTVYSGESIVFQYFPTQSTWKRKF